MAGYRNRLIHFYSEISIEEIFNIIKFELTDFQEFSMYIKRIIVNPEDFGFTVI